MNSDSLGFLLVETSRLMRRAFQQRMVGLAFSFEQVRILVLLSRREGMRQVEMADVLEVHAITLVHQIDRLAEAGLLERRPDPTDRRAYQLFLTPAAAPHLATIQQIAATLQAEMCRGLSAEQTALVLSSLTTVRDNLAARSAS